MNTKLDILKKNWDDFGSTDPLYAISTFKDKKGNKWDPDEFFQTGIIQINQIMELIEKLNINSARKKALDFGCGVGRCTQALALHFDTVDGVDIAPSMIVEAKKFNKFGNLVHYHLNDKNNLQLFDDNYFDLIYTTDVLQHMDKKYSFDYLKEFIRILSSGGVLVFQVPSEHKNKLINFLYETNLLHYVSYFYHKILKDPFMGFHLIKKEAIVSFFDTDKTEIVKIVDDPRGDIISYRYFVIKK